MKQKARSVLVGQAHVGAGLYGVLILGRHSRPTGADAERSGIQSGRKAQPVLVKQAHVGGILWAYKVAADDPGQVVVRGEVVQQLVDAVAMVKRDLICHHVCVQVRDQAARAPLRHLQRPPLQLILNMATGSTTALELSAPTSFPADC